MTEPVQYERKYPAGVGDLLSVVSPEYLKNQSVEIGEAVPGETAVRRNAMFADKLMERIPQFPELTTVYELVSFCVEKYAKRPWIGVREKLANGKNGEYQWQTFEEFGVRRMHVAAGFAAAGFESGEFVGVCAVNNPEWLLSEFAAHAYGGATVGLYPTLGVASVQFIIEQSQCSFVVCGEDWLDRFIEFAGKEWSHFNAIVVIGQYSDAQKANAEKNGSKLWSFDEIESLGKEKVNDYPHTPPKPDDIFAIMYTSGSTGTPKGVVMRHRNIIAQVACVCSHDAGTCGWGEGEECYFSFLPLVHALEKSVFYSCATGGGMCGIYSGDMKNIVDDIATLKPYTIIGTPRVYDRVRDKFTQAVVGGGFFKKLLWNWGYPAKVQALKEGRTTPWWDSILFSKLSAKLGGKVRRFLTAGAPLDPTMGEFLAVCFNAPIIQGYGATENFGPATMTYLRDWDDLTVGPPCPTHEVKLLDCPEMNYLSTDKPFPRGEVLLRGTGVFTGYYKMDEITNQVLDKDGWYHSGDIGTYDEKGRLKIIDRVKSIFKLSQGEYVAAEYLENIFQRSPLVAQCYISATPFADAVVAVFTMDGDCMKLITNELGVRGSVEELCKEKKVYDLIMKEIHRLGDEAQLNKYEYPRDFFLEPNLFSVENDLLTPTFKLRRANATIFYREKIEELCKK